MSQLQIGPVPCDTSNALSGAGGGGGGGTAAARSGQSEKHGKQSPVDPGAVPSQGAPVSIRLCFIRSLTLPDSGPLAAIKVCGPYSGIPDSGLLAAFGASGPFPVTRE